MSDPKTPSSDSKDNQVEAPSSTVEVAVNSPAEPARSGGKGLALTAILFSLVAIGGSGFNFYSTQMAKQADQGSILSGVTSIGGDVKVLAERIGQLQRNQQRAEQSAVTQEQLQTRLLQVGSQSDLALRDIKSAQQSVEEMLKKLSENAERGADKFALDEVSQLLKLANNSAVFSNNKESAISALKLADSQLKQLADPRYAVVRRTINEEINALEAVKSVDSTSLTAQLNKLANRVPNLPLENEPPVAGQVEIVKSADEPEMTVSGQLSVLWEKTLDVVKVKRVDQPPKPLLEPEQRYFLDQNIQLKLATAELAVMQGRSQVYQRSIDDALQWILDYYDPRNDEVIKTVAELRELSKQQFGAELPSIVGSYDALQRIKGGN